MADARRRAAITSFRRRSSRSRSIATTSRSSAACIIRTASARRTSARTRGSPARRSMRKARASTRTRSPCDQIMAETTGQQTRFSSLELSISAGTGRPLNRPPSPSRATACRCRRRIIRRRSSIASSARKPAASPRSARAWRSAAACSTPCSMTRNRLRRELGAGRPDQARRISALRARRGAAHRAARFLARHAEARSSTRNCGQAFPARRVPKAKAGEYWRTMFDLIVLALRTDMTRVVTYMNGSEGNGLAIPEIGITAGAAQSFAPQRRPRGARTPRRTATRSSWSSSRISSTSSHAIKDGDEPLLDRTMVLFGSGMSYGHSHVQQQPAHPPRRRSRPRAQARPAHRLQPAAPEGRLHAQLRRMARRSAANRRTRKRA